MTVTTTSFGVLLSAALSLVIASAALADEPTAGQVLYKQKCAMCHGPSGMGTLLLGRRMDKDETQLETRTDLTEDFVIEAARSGVGNMPRIPRGDVSDQELSLIAAYLAQHDARISGKGEKK